MTELQGGAVRRADDIFGYKPFVDGLRAISILSVVAFHAGVPGVSGGFVGVDIFFVISGYLIINQILAGVGRGTFSFAEFWARRALRILPPFLLVIAVSLLVAKFLLVTRPSVAEFGREAAFSALMVVNHYFLAEQGYFDTAADLKPLLHMWSLAVEEQFYLAAPLAIVLLSGISRRLVAKRAAFWSATVGGLFLASLVACVALTGNAKNPSFYLAPTRAWEFIAGGAVPALAYWLGPRPVAGTALAALGLGMILIAVFAFTLDTPFPSFTALLPVGGAVLILVGGSVNRGNPVARGLSVAPMVWIGLVSYAWYLWHWPLLSFFRHYNFGDRDFARDGLAILLALVLAVATHVFLERPLFRLRHRARATAAGWRIVAAGGVAAGLIAILGAVFVSFVAPRVEAAVPASLHPRSEKSEIEKDPCASGPDQDFRPACWTQAAGKPYGLLLGNSHALMIYPEVKQEAGALLLTLFLAGCPPYDFPPGRWPAGLRCAKPFARHLDRIDRRLAAAQFAILSARWNLDQEKDDPESVDVATALRAAGITAIPPEADIRPVLAAGLAGTLAQLRAMGIRHILIVGPVPEFPRHVPQCLVRAYRYGVDADRCSIPRGVVDARRKRTVATLAFLAAQHSDVRLIDPIDLFCDEELCRPYDDGGSFYGDDDHLSRHGAAKLLAAFRADFAWAFGKDTAP